MKIIAIAENDQLMVHMSRDEWAQLNGYATGSAYSPYNSFAPGTIKDVSKQLDQIRWLRTFRDTLKKHAEELGTAQNLMLSTVSMFLDLEAAKIPASASQEAAAEFKGLRPLIRPVKPVLAGELQLDAAAGFDLYPHPNTPAKKEPVGIAPDADL